MHKAITSDKGKRFVYVNWKWGEEIEEKEEKYLLEDSILDEVFAIYDWIDEYDEYHCQGNVYQNEEEAKKRVEECKKMDRER